tara:strand:- start:4869 stop:4979 length:111 start_codon:yes stop_codon:yes gene_type:complete
MKKKLIKEVNGKFGNASVSDSNILYHEKKMEKYPSN